MKPLTKQYVISNSKPHSVMSDIYPEARQYKESVGNYLLSIVGGANGLYGDFLDTFEVAVIDESDGRFVTGLFSKRGDDVLAYASLDEINEIYFNLPRK